VGAFVVCKKLIRDLLINKMRSFIFSTALPPINIAWTFYVMSNLKKYSDRRNKLQNISNYFCRELNIKGFKNNSKSQIIPIILKYNNITLEKSEELLRNNIYVLAVRPPTVPVGTSRLRFSLNSNITIEDINKILKFF
ncbi:MAG: aminotransferase class I/II-fold pyridoxal phosphate-dependent enzyme, partial [Bacteroidetes bacterium]|nr:aminotransferase class I/II-fold pyridoxal phosphate-dependent enzyme [Bacteroidota bacterium]